MIKRNVRRASLPPVDTPYPQPSENIQNTGTNSLEAYQNQGLGTNGSSKRKQILRTRVYGDIETPEPRLDLPRNLRRSSKRVRRLSIPSMSAIRALQVGNFTSAQDCSTGALATTIEENPFGLNSRRRSSAHAYQRYSLTDEPQPSRDFEMCLGKHLETEPDRMLASQDDSYCTQRLLSHRASTSIIGSNETASDDYNARRESVLEAIRWIDESLHLRRRSLPLFQNWTDEKLKNKARVSEASVTHVSVQAPTRFAFAESETPSKSKFIGQKLSHEDTARTEIERDEFELTLGDGRAQGSTTIQSQDDSPRSILEEPGIQANVTSATTYHRMDVSIQDLGQSLESSAPSPHQGPDTEFLAIFDLDIDLDFDPGDQSSLVPETHLRQRKLSNLSIRETHFRTHRDSEELARRRIKQKQRESDGVIFHLDLARSTTTKIKKHPRLGSSNSAEASEGLES